MKKGVRMMHAIDESYDDALMRREGKQLMRRGTMKQGGLGVEGETERVERGGDGDT